MNYTFTTGVDIRGTLKRWAKIGSTAHFATFCRVEWSQDVVNEKGVMFFTDETVRVKLNKRGGYYKKPFGNFTLDERTPVILKTRPTK